MQYEPWQIIAGLMDKDPAVFQYLYRTYGGKIVRYVMRNSGSEEDAREVVQVTLTELWMAVRDGRYQEQGKFERYLFQVAVKTWKEELRRRRNRPQTHLDTQQFEVRDDQAEDLVQAVWKDRQIEAIHRGLEQLDPTCRDLVSNYHLRQIDLQEIARQMEYDYNNLRKRIFDCRKKLKKIAEALLGDARWPASLSAEVEDPATEQL